MAVKKEITLCILPDGKIEIETHGFKGPECEEEINDIVKPIAEVKTRKRKKEYYESAPLRAKKKQTTSTK